MAHRGGGGFHGGGGYHGGYGYRGGGFRGGWGWGAGALTVPLLYGAALGSTVAAASQPSVVVVDQSPQPVAYLPVASPDEISTIAAQYPQYTVTYVPGRPA